MVKLKMDETVGNIKFHKRTSVRVILSRCIQQKCATILNPGRIFDELLLRLVEQQKYDSLESNCDHCTMLMRLCLV